MVSYLQGSLPHAEHAELFTLIDSAEENEFQELITDTLDSMEESEHVPAFVRDRVAVLHQEILDKIHANPGSAKQTVWSLGRTLSAIAAAIVVLVALKVPALPALVVGVFLGFICQIFVQGGNIGEAVNTLHDGFAIASGNEMVDELFNRGGIASMMFTVSLTIFAMVFGGVLEHTGMLKAIVKQILKVAKSAGSLIAATIVSAFFTNATASEQYISILLPGRMYATAFQDKGLHSKNLSRALEDGGTLTSPFIPWNTCGVFILATLSVSPFAYAPYAVLNYAVPIIGIVMAIIGYKVQFLTEDEMQQLKIKQQRIDRENELTEGV